MVSTETHEMEPSFIARTSKLLCRVLQFSIISSVSEDQKKWYKQQKNVLQDNVPEYIRKRIKDY